MERKLMMLQPNENNLVERNELVKEEITSIEAKFDEIIDKFKNSKFFRQIDLKLMIFLGALLNDTTYRQKRYFKTGSIPNELVSLFKLMSLRKAKILWKSCDRLQNSIAKTKYVPRSFLYEKVKSQIEKIGVEDWKSDKKDLSLALISGYNLYSLAILKTFGKKKSKDPTFSKILSYRNYQDNKSFEIGFFTGIYIFRILKLQIKELRTTGLLKYLNPFLRSPHYKQLKALLRESNAVSIKLNSTNKSNNQNSEINTFLPCDSIQIEIFKRIANSPEIVNKRDLFLGFIKGFVWENSIKFLKDKKNFLEQADDPEIVIHKEKTMVTESHLIHRYKERKYHSKAEKVAYLLGVFFQSVNHEEKNILNTQSLIKSFNSIFRHFDRKNLYMLYSEIYKTYIKLWINQVKNTFQISDTDTEKIFYYSKLKFIRMKLVDLLGSLQEIQGESELSIAFIQGYESFFKLFKELNP